MAVYSLVLYEISHIYTQAYSSFQASKHYSEEESQVNIKQVSTRWTLGHVVSRPKSSDLNPILAAGNTTINLISKEGERQIPLDSHFLRKSPEASLKSEEVVLSVYIPRSTQLVPKSIPIWSCKVNLYLRVQCLAHRDRMSWFSL
ncbi:hypothetical protein J1605_013062 [Eschrichtius robustus]|uniref:Molybdopterin dehydrogenase FAD-binding domain-containing protein n=1 Tax=Eschrichtius robustus TaxID=9764 RepID=A0AB34GHQ4_ESCRO|nr:hypothetical protein J1605_013062 [Eschrichtius robustus]